MRRPIRDTRGVVAPTGTVAPGASSISGLSHPFLPLSVPREPLATSPFQGPEPRTRAQPGPWAEEAGVTTPFHHFYSFHCLPSVPKLPPGSPPPRITPAAIPGCSLEMAARSHSAAGGTVKTWPCWWKAGGCSQLWGRRQKSVMQEPWLTVAIAKVRTLSPPAQDSCHQQWSFVSEDREPSSSLLVWRWLTLGLQD